MKDGQDSGNRRSAAAAAGPASRSAAVPLRLKTPLHTDILKEELCSRVEVIRDAERTLVRKTYRNRPFFLWRSFLMPSRAAREFRNLRAIVAAGVPCIEPVAFEDVRVLGCVPRSVLYTTYVPDAPSLKIVLGRLDRARPAERALRRRIVTAWGRLVRDLHEAGFLSGRAMPRNVLVEQTAPAVRLLLCDQPVAIRARSSITATRRAAIDLYDVAFSRSRRRELARSERCRLLLTYCEGDRAAARRLWRRLARLPRWLQRLHRAMLVAWDSYLLGLARRSSTGAGPA